MHRRADRGQATAAWAVGLLLADLALAAALFAGAWAHPASVTAGGRQDAPYTIWALSWTARAVTHGSSPWVTTALSWPGGVNLLANASVTGLGLVLFPVTAMFGPLVAYNVVATAALGATAWSAQLVIRRGGLASWPAAAAGGLVAGFGPTSVVQTSGGHLHVSAAFLVPPMLLGVGRLATGTARSAWRWGAAVGALAAAQLLVGEEVLALTAITAVVALALVGTRVDWAVLARGAVIAGVTFLVLAGYPLAVQFTGPGRILGPIQSGQRYADDLLAFVAPVRQMWLRSAAIGRLVGGSSEQGAYLGIPMVLVAVVTAVRRRHEPLVRLIGVSGLVVAVLSFGPRLIVAGSHTPIPLVWGLLAHLPLLGSVLPVRFGLLLDLAAGALLAVALDGATAWAVSVWAPGMHRRRLAWAGPVPVAVATVLAVACILPMVPTLPATTTAWSVPPLFGMPARAGIADGSVVVVSPYASPSHPEVEVWLAEAGDRWRSSGGTYFVPDAKGRVTIGGPPRVADVVDVAIERGATARSLASMAPGVRLGLARDGVGAVLVGPGPRREEVLAWWSGVLGAPRWVGGVAVWTATRPPGPPATP